MKKMLFSLTLLFGFIGTAHAFDGDAEAGKAKSAVCAACHNADGNSAIDFSTRASLYLLEDAIIIMTIMLGDFSSM